MQKYIRQIKAIPTQIESRCSALHREPPRPTAYHAQHRAVATLRGVLGHGAVRQSQQSGGLHQLLGKVVAAATTTIAASAAAAGAAVTVVVAVVTAATAAAAAAAIAAAAIVPDPWLAISPKGHCTRFHVLEASRSEQSFVVGTRKK